MRWGSRPAVSCAVVILLSGCGARTALDGHDEDDEGDGGTCGVEAEPRVLVCEELTTGPSPTCTMRGGEEVVHRVTCDGERCGWYTNGALQCECTDLDLANTCSNGVPTCASWLGYLDFAALRRCP